MKIFPFFRARIRFPLTWTPIMTLSQRVFSNPLHNIFCTVSSRDKVRIVGVIVLLLESASLNTCCHTVFLLVTTDGKTYVQNVATSAQTDFIVLVVYVVVDVLQFLLISCIAHCHPFRWRSPSDGRRRKKNPTFFSMESKTIECCRMVKVDARKHWIQT